MQEKEFSIVHPDQSLPSVWWEGTSGGLVEPIWVTAEKHGVITAIHMWPGSEAVIHGVRPSHVDNFNEYEILSNKVKRVMSWLDLQDSERPAFIATYVPTIDVGPPLLFDFLIVDDWTPFRPRNPGNEFLTC